MYPTHYVRTHTLCITHTPKTSYGTLRQIAPNHHLYGSPDKGAMFVNKTYPLVGPLVCIVIYYMHKRHCLISKNNAKMHLFHTIYNVFWASTAISRDHRPRRLYHVTTGLDGYITWPQASAVISRDHRPRRLYHVTTGLDPQFCQSG